MSVALYVLRSIQLGLNIADLELIEQGFVMDMITELGNDDYKYEELASQNDFNRF